MFSFKEFRKTKISPNLKTFLSLLYLTLTLCATAKGSLKRNR